jgi:hypothetical protein
MSYLRRFGLAVLLALVVSAVLGVGSASATALYSGATKLGAGTTVKSSLAGTSTLTTTEGTVLDTCAGGESSGSTSNAGGAAETIKITILTIEERVCTFHTTWIISHIAWEIHWTSGLNGTLTGSGGELTINTGLFGSCVFTLGTGTTLGTVTGSTTGNATIDLNSILTRKTGLCPATAKWVGTWKITSPSLLHVTAS